MSISTQESIEAARQLLELGGVFYYTRDDILAARGAGEDAETIENMTDHLQELNLNDAFAWALAYSIKASDDELPELARLYCDYGRCGILYWAAEKDGWKRAEFEDVTRHIQFVREEERIRKEVTDYNARAYAKRVYTLGQLPKD